MTKPILLSSNQNKINEFKHIMGDSILYIDDIDLPIEIINRINELPEIQAISVADVVTHKTRSAYQILKKPVIVDDTGLYDIDNKTQFPGALIKWFLNADYMNYIMNHNVVVETCIGYTNDGVTIHIFSGKIHGVITSPKGTNGFGFDKYVLVNEINKTFAELTNDEKNDISHRKKAIQHFNGFLL